jgi:hypothetical protein
MARQSTGLQFAIHFRVRPTDHAHRAVDNVVVIIQTEMVRQIPLGRVNG